ncbi:7591_t:CDS:2 [Funneliformis caledonium]|uniref:7591_t:CDS:1 n=1 Tax=Funneliformis caledonium TaxID=1117310 RepID=A0A9N9CUM5_9GLOM|nr:7591_t:CDS:2 [Funneliformis caledonium]
MIALVNNLRLRFLDTGIYNAMKIFDFSQIPTKSNEIAIYGKHEIKILGDFYGSSKYQNEQVFLAKSLILQMDGDGFLPVLNF